MMTNKELVAKCIDIAKNYKTLYVYGCFGSPITGANVSRFTNNYDYNRGRASMIKAVANQNPPCYGFDCVNLIKGILWGWNGDASKTHGGAVYKANGVPDLSADGFFANCTGVSSYFKNIEVGEAVWLRGHIGIYIGDGLAVECSPKWQNKVQITAVGNLGSKSGYNTRTWTKHGKIPYITYVQEAKPAVTPKPTTCLKVGDTVIIKSGATYGGLTSARGKAVPSAYIGKAYKISGLAAHKGVNEALLAGLNSWVSVGYLTLKTGSTGSTGTINVLQSAKSMLSGYGRGKKFTVTASTPLRYGAGTNYGVITTLAKGTKVMFYGYYTDNYYYVQINGRYGFIDRFKLS